MLPREQKSLIERSAALHGRTVTDVVLTSRMPSARSRNTIRSSSRSLTVRPSFMQLLGPKPVNDRLRDTVRRYRERAGVRRVVGEMQRKLRVEPLTSGHDRSGFECCVVPLDRYFRGPRSAEMGGRIGPQLWCCCCRTRQSRATTRCRRGPCNSATCRNKRRGCCRDIHWCRQCSWAPCAGSAANNERIRPVSPRRCPLPLARSEIAAFAVIDRGCEG